MHTHTQEVGLRSAFESVGSVPSSSLMVLLRVPLFASVGDVEEGEQGSEEDKEEEEASGPEFILQ